MEQRFRFSRATAPTLLRDLLTYIDTLDAKKQYVVEVKQHREKRSLDANAYFWVLAHRLAEATGVPVVEIYRDAIKNIGGVSEHYCGKPEAIERLCGAWGRQGLGWIAETYESKLPGMVNATLYYGSSSYDRKQMARLIDNIVQDCEAVGIETDTPEQIARRLEEWPYG